MINEVEHVTVLRDCNAITIPVGATVTLAKGRNVVITQSVGGSYTVNDSGQLLRIAGEDGDALGKSAVVLSHAAKQSIDDGGVNFVQIYDQIKTCYDPEIPVNIVDLGLIYDVNCYEMLDGRNLVRIKMTLTAFGCGMGSVMADEVRSKCLSLPNVDDVEVAIVYDPPWSADMMSDAAKLELGLL